MPAGRAGRAHQGHWRFDVRALQAWFIAGPDRRDTAGCTHICCREPRTHMRGLHITTEGDLGGLAVDPYRRQDKPAICS